MIVFKYELFNMFSIIQVGGFKHFLFSIIYGIILLINLHKYIYIYVIGGLEDFYHFHSVGNAIIPTDSYFSEG